VHVQALQPMPQQLQELQPKDEASQPLMEQPLPVQVLVQVTVTAACLVRPLPSAKVWRDTF
jgi:hypothetical protein